MKRLFSAETHSITGAAIILSAASLISRLIGLLRDRIFASTFGAGEILDAYYAAFRFPDLVYQLIVVGALSAGFIPLFRELYSKKQSAGWEFVGALLPKLGLVLLLLSAGIFFFADHITTIIAPAFSPDAATLTTVLTRIFALSPLILGLSAVTSGVLQATKAFAIYAITPIVYNVGIIIGVLVFVPLLGPIGLGWGVILGAVLHLGVQLPALFMRGYRPIFTLKSHPKVTELLKLSWPRMLALGSTQITLVIMTMYATMLGEGSVAVFTLALNIGMTPISLIGVSFALAAFPTLCEYATQGGRKRFLAHLGDVSRKILFFITPISLFFILFRSQLVRLIYGAGQFGWEDTILTANALGFFALSLFAQTLTPLYARAYFALKNTRIPLATSVLGAAISIGYGYIGAKEFGPAGITFALSLGAVAQWFLLWFILRARLGGAEDAGTARAVQIIVVSTIAAASLMQLLKYPLADIVDMTRFWGIAMQTVVAGGFGFGLYAGLCSLLRLKEMTLVQSAMKRKWLHLRSVTAGIISGDEVGQ